MPIQHKARYRILANLLQTSFGKSSLVKYPTHFLKMSLVNDSQIVVKYNTTITFGHQNVYLELRRKLREEANDIIKAHLEKIVEEYKEAIQSKDKLLEPRVQPYEAPPEKTISLKLQEHTVSENLEYVSKSIYNPDQQKAFYHIQCVVEVK